MPLKELIDEGIFKLGATVLRGGPNARLSILIYHRVLPAPDPLLPYEVDARQFRRHMGLISRHCRVFPLPEALDRLHTDRLPERSVCITFDDGYRDNAEIALPILQTLGVNATFFIATGYLDGGIMFNDAIIEAIRHYAHDSLDLSRHDLGCHPVSSDEQKADAIDRLLPLVKYLPQMDRQQIAQEIADNSSQSLPREIMMTREQLLRLHDSGMSIGAHTRTHPILARVADDKAFSEITLGKQDLEDLIGEPIRLFAYPNGKMGSDYDHRHVNMVRQAGFEAAVSTNHGVSSKETDRFQLARYTPWDRQDWRFAMRLVENGRWVASTETQS